MEKRRKIFDDGATVVEDVTVKNKKKPELNVEIEKNIYNRDTRKKIVKAEDVFDAFAGYLPAQANFMPTDSQGKCIICGMVTSSSMRKLCFPCLKDKGEDLYKKAKKSIENGDKEFQI